MSSSYRPYIISGICILSGVVFTKSIFHKKQKDHEHNNTIILKDTKYHSTGIYRPLKATNISAGWDLYSQDDLVIPAGERRLISTGWSLFSLPSKYYLRIAPRSGLACKGIDIGAGVVDADYRGELKVLMINNSSSEYKVGRTTRIAQLIPEYCGNLELVTCNSNKSNVIRVENEKVRGVGGFGSTDK